MTPLIFLLAGYHKKERLITIFKTQFHKHH